jgi:DNA-directed RNA polymerase subunit beta'
LRDFEQQYQEGLITQQEKYNKVIDAWSRCGDQVAAEMMKEIQSVKARMAANCRSTRST